MRITLPLSAGAKEKKKKKTLLVRVPCFLLFFEDAEGRGEKREAWRKGFERFRGDLCLLIWVWIGGLRGLIWWRLRFC